MPLKDPVLRMERQREYQKKWYSNPVNHAKQNANVQRIRAVRKAWATGLKAGKPCADCNGTFDPVAMDWDHLPGHTKSFNVSTMAPDTRSEAAILAEIAKCELVCSNCHRVRTKLRRASSKQTRGPRASAPLDATVATVHP